MATVAPVLPLPQPAPSVPATTAGAAVTRGVGNGFRDMVAEATDREPAAQPTRDASAPQRTERVERNDRTSRTDRTDRSARSDDTTGSNGKETEHPGGMPAGEAAGEMASSWHPSGMLDMRVDGPVVSLRSTTG